MNCPHCGKPRQGQSGYCRACQRVYMLGWRAGRKAAEQSVDARLARIEAHLVVEGSHVKPPRVYQLGVPTVGDHMPFCTLPPDHPPGCAVIASGEMHPESDAAKRYRSVLA